MAFDVLRDRLAAVIREGRVRYGTVASSLYALGHIDLSQVKNLQEACALWLRQIFDSGYPEHARWTMANPVVEMFGKLIDSLPPGNYSHIHFTMLRPLSDFLLLNEKFCSALDEPTRRGVIALRMLSIGVGALRTDPLLLPTLTPAILQILTSTLLSTHPLRPRRLALCLFQRTEPGWFSTQAEASSNAERAKLLEAVGDPFQFSPDPPPEDGKPQASISYKPIRNAALLIEFAGTDLWRDHLCPSNFTSCEEVLSTEEGRGGLFQETLRWGLNHRMRHNNKLAPALRRLGEMECWNTAEVVVT